MIYVEAGSRLHLGFYNIKEGNWFYGSLGVYIEEPKTIVKIEEKKSDEYKKEEAKIFRYHLNICGEGNVSYSIVTSPPSQKGLGSTTQLSLSIAKGLSVICSKKINLKKIAVLAGRGTISGIGIYGFIYGGFLVDSGRFSKENKLEPPSKVKDLPQLITRISFPYGWKVVIIVPRKKIGLKEEDEKFMLSPNEEKELGRKLRLSLWEKTIRGLISKNIGLFGKGIEDIQKHMGEYFSKYQGGEFSSEETEKAVEVLRHSGTVGIGQSSWGPAAYGFYEVEKEEEIRKKIEKEIYKKDIDADVYFSGIRNHGYKIREKL
ncbi:hypothetical protein IOK49_05820 [Fervidicoccus fontis]|uniref:Beta-ribofuranosylaminobenzene 5'-phosphate synthase n=2 Tax=Fervidicoccus fontis TaxID=683846 RepID=I0A1E0_FERFK|nr:beta-ribofuranosylaminobenzene 5'-phosphate synthase family protein [Fervidicoccus fontis]AFH42797.1 GHMP kinase [Fervidicoccus fontis Kam940]MBE9391583.1 hypothetical protein [Fervidicoccus fontis]PMB76869.1 MAG: homoserine kinase [Fervidicoccus fontis]